MGFSADDETDEAKTLKEYLDEVLDADRTVAHDEGMEKPQNSVRADYAESLAQALIV